MPVPAQPKIYHIVHVDRLESILRDGCLWSDAEVQRRKCAGTTIGMSNIKRRRLEENTLASHPRLRVGDCVPFYFCPRSIMLYMIWRGNHEDMTYHGGQIPIIHLEADLHAVVKWAGASGKRWAFTLSNAGSSYFEDHADLGQLHRINWAAVQTTRWSGNGVDHSIKEGKQAEFLVETSFPWNLVARIGVYSDEILKKMEPLLSEKPYQPSLAVHNDWYY
jgi:hypothetical protein